MKIKYKAYFILLLLLALMGAAVYSIAHVSGDPESVLLPPHPPDRDHPAAGGGHCPHH